MACMELYVTSMASEHRIYWFRITGGNLWVSCHHFLYPRKMKDERLEVKFVIIGGFQGNFVIDKHLKMVALEPFSCSVFFRDTHQNYRKF